MRLHNGCRKPHTCLGPGVHAGTFAASEAYEQTRTLGAMDVRGPTRAATKRLIQGMAVACATAAVYAPMAGASSVTTSTTPPRDAGRRDVRRRSGPGGHARAHLPTAGGPGLQPPRRRPGVRPSAPDPLNVNDCLIGAPATVPVPARSDDGQAQPRRRHPVTRRRPASDLAVDGNTGTDQLDLSARTTPATVDLDGTAAGGMTLSAVENATGGSADDTINGDGLNNRESGSGGNDTLNGNGGDDTLNGGTGDDSLNGDTGINALRGGAGTDALAAGDEGDLLVGGPDPDTMTGGAGDDDIVAADGFADTITCGAGVDSVVADLGANGVTDTIVDPTACESVTGSVAVLPDPPPTTDPGTTTTTIQPVIVVPATGTPALVPVLAPGRRTSRTSRRRRPRCAPSPASGSPRSSTAASRSA